MNSGQLIPNDFGKTHPFSISPIWPYIFRTPSAEPPTRSPTISIPLLHCLIPSGRLHKVLPQLRRVCPWLLPHLFLDDTGKTPTPSFPWPPSTHLVNELCIQEIDILSRIINHSCNL